MQLHVSQLTKVGLEGVGRAAAALLPPGPASSPILGVAVVVVHPAVLAVGIPALLPAAGIGAVEVVQDLVRRQVDVVDAVAVDLDAGVEGAGGLGEVDSGGTAAAAAAGSTAPRGPSVVVAVDQLVHVLDELEAPGVAGVDLVLGVHADGLAVHLAEVLAVERGGTGGVVGPVLAVGGVEAAGEAEEAGRRAAAAGLGPALLLLVVVGGVGAAADALATDGTAGGGGRRLLRGRIGLLRIILSSILLVRRIGVPQGGHVGLVGILVVAGGEEVPLFLGRSDAALPGSNGGHVGLVEVLVVAGQNEAGVVVVGVESGQGRYAAGASGGGSATSAGHAGLGVLKWERIHTL